MKFKIDENLPIEVADLLKREGHDAVTVIEQHLGGCFDQEIAEICQQEKRVLVTLDAGFADIRVYPPKNFFGLIVLRLRLQDKPHVLEIVANLSNMFSAEPVKGHLWIVEEKRIRIRG